MGGTIVLNKQGKTGECAHEKCFIAESKCHDLEFINLGDSRSGYSVQD